MKKIFAVLFAFVLVACGSPTPQAQIITEISATPTTTAARSTQEPIATAVPEEPQGEIVYALSDNTTESGLTLWSLKIGESSPHQISDVDGAINPVDEHVEWMKLLGGGPEVAFFVKEHQPTTSDPDLDGLKIMIYNRQERTQPVNFTADDPRSGDSGFVQPFYWVSGERQDQIYHFSVEQWTGIIWYMNFSTNLNDQDPAKCRFGANVHLSPDWRNLIISYQWKNEPCSSGNNTLETYWGWEIVDGEYGKVLYQYEETSPQETARGWLNDHEIVIETFFPGINETGLYVTEQSCIAVSNLLAQDEVTPYCQYSNPDGIGYVSTSPDGRFIAYVINNDELQVFDMQTPWSGANTILKGCKNLASIPIWSPDSQWIAFALNGNTTSLPNSLYAVRFDGSDMQLLILEDNILSAYGWFPSLK